MIVRTALNRKNFFSLYSLLIATSLLCACERYASDGERIYFTGRNDEGDLIQAIVDRSGLKDREREITCALCHGNDRKGRRNPIPEFGPFLAPSLTRESLLKNSRKRPAYDRASLAKSIHLGKSSSGKALHHPMPRWQLSDRDMEALIRYLFDE